MNHLSSSGGQLNHPEVKPNDTKQEGAYCIINQVCNVQESLLSSSGRGSTLKYLFLETKGCFKQNNTFCKKGRSRRQDN